MCRDPQAGEVMIKTHSTSLNPADWKSAEGEQAALLSFDWPRVFGFDFAGTVHSIGSDLSIFKVGDPVFGMIQGLPERDRGTLQEYFVVNEKVCASKPENVTMSQAAALPLVCITAVRCVKPAVSLQLQRK
jgi:NADPH:quinone reductase-like Zn-dependent oxidoreductase